MAIKTENNIRYWFHFKDYGETYTSKNFETCLISSSKLEKHDVLASLQIPDGCIIFSSQSNRNLVLTPDSINERSKNMNLCIDYELIDSEEIHV